MFGCVKVVGKKFAERAEMSIDESSTGQIGIFSGDLSFEGGLV